mmetsp:Transcript_18230/g.18295  ORF Transcript_18230/g.18295 Transcript_18230/m.18295 type:complete len:128 (+) Transcript_18230:89-472(+)
MLSIAFHFVTITMLASTQAILSSRLTIKGNLVMKDASTIGYFRIGDSVRIISDVPHRSQNGTSFCSNGFTGKVVEVWEKCEVDPHCCCAELAFDAPIQVQFTGEKVKQLMGSDEWCAHFALDEIEKL